MPPQPVKQRMKNVVMGHPIPRPIYDLFSGAVPRTKKLDDATALVYSRVRQVQEELLDVFHDQNFLKLLSADSDTSTRVGRFATLGEKNATQRKIGMVAAWLTTQLDERGRLEKRGAILRGEVAAALLYLYVKQPELFKETA